MEQNFYTRLTGILSDGQVLVNEPMSRHTTFRIGGAADYFVIPSTAEEVQQALKLCREMQEPYYIIGNGSNLLVSDHGYRGTVIQIYKQMSRIETEGLTLRVQAGALLSQAASAAFDAGLAGLEFASGIPGTVGGACVMNAGAYGREMRDVLLEVTVMAKDGEILKLPLEKLELGYRTSLIMKKGYTVLEALFQLMKGSMDEIRARMEELKAKRTGKQPLEFPSAGSTFKRPEGYYAGKLIQDAGLRGFTLGGAMVSEKHCGFVINYKDATAAEVDDLMRHVIDRVREQSGITLEPEVKRLGDF